MNSPNSGEFMVVPAIAGAGAAVHEVEVVPATSEQRSTAELELLREGTSANSTRSYRAAARYWVAWYRLRLGREIQLPVPVADVVRFVEDHVQRGGDKPSVQLRHELPPEIDALLVEAGAKGKPGPLSLNTVRHRVAVLSKLHEERGFSQDNPCRNPRLTQLLQKARVAHSNRNQHARKAPALTREHLRALLATCEADLAGKRDRALLLFAFASGGRRRSELSRADMQHLKATEYGYRYWLGHSKTNQTGEDSGTNWKPVRGPAAQALTEWLQAAQITEGRIFRRVDRHGRPRDSLSPDGVAQIVKRRCALAGLTDPFTAHSLRSGFMTEAGRRQVPLHEIMAMSDHRSEKVALGYMQVDDNARSRAARLLEEDDSDEPSPTGAGQ